MPDSRNRPAPLPIWQETRIRSDMRLMIEADASFAAGLLVLKEIAPSEVPMVADFMEVKGYKESGGRFEADFAVLSVVDGLVREAAGTASGVAWPDGPVMDRVASAHGRPGSRGRVEFETGISAGVPAMDREIVEVAPVRASTGSLSGQAAGIAGRPQGAAADRPVAGLKGPDEAAPSLAQRMARLVGRGGAQR
jgi:hypothetical protein